MIETRLLYYFKTVADEQSITKAAEYLHISQPALSQQLIELEKRLGKKLFLRAKKNIILTEEGEFLYKHAKEILKLTKNFEKSFKKSDQPICGNISIGCGEHYNMLSVMKLLKQMKDDFPEIQINIYSGIADDLFEHLEKGFLDVAFMLEPSVNAHFEYQKLSLKEQWGVLMRKDCPLALKDAVDLSEICKYPLLLPNQTCNGNQVVSWFGKSGEEIQVAATYNLIYNASLMVEAGMGNCLCLDHLINITPDSSLTFIPLNPRLYSYVYCVTKRNVALSNVTTLFLEKVVSHLSNPLFD